MQKPFLGETRTGAPMPPSASGVQPEGRQREVEVTVRGVEDEGVGTRRCRTAATARALWV